MICDVVVFVAAMVTASASPPKAAVFFLSKSNVLLMSGMEYFFNVEGCISGRK